MCVITANSNDQQAQNWLYKNKICLKYYEENSSRRLPMLCAGTAVYKWSLFIHCACAEIGDSSRTVLFKADVICDESDFVPADYYYLLSLHYQFAVN